MQMLCVAGQTVNNTFLSCGFKAAPVPFEPPTEPQASVWWFMHTFALPLQRIHLHTCSD